MSKRTLQSKGYLVGFERVFCHFCKKESWKNTTSTQTGDELLYAES